MHPGGVRTAMALFFFYKVSFEKHPNEHVRFGSPGRIFKDPSGPLTDLMNLAVPFYQVFDLGCTLHMWVHGFSPSLDIII